MSEYLREELLRLVARPTVGEILARAQARHGGVASREDIVRVIREARDDPPGRP